MPHVVLLYRERKIHTCEEDILFPGYLSRHPTLWACLVSWMRSDQAGGMQVLVDWRPGPVQLHAKESSRPGSREMIFISVSSGPGSLHASWLTANDGITR
jgi:hypothetical protein